MPFRLGLFGVFFVKAGIPDGVLNVVPGFGQTAGAAISSHMDIDAVMWEFQIIELKMKIMMPN